MEKLGINMLAYKGIDDSEYIKAIAGNGFTATFSGVFDAERQLKIANDCLKNGVEYENLHAPFSHINDIWYEGENGDRMLDELLDCVYKCELAGIKTAVIHLSSGEFPPPLTEIGKERFFQLVDFAKNKNVKLAFENQRKFYNLKWALKTFSKDDGVGFCWDCGHENCFTPGQEFMPIFGNRIICTHIHDNNGVYNDDSHLLPFDGNIDFKKVIYRLEKANFSGSLMLEVTAANEKYDKISFEEYLRRAFISAKKLTKI